MKRILLIAILVALPLAAQEKKQEFPPADAVQKLFILKYVEPRAVEVLMRVFNAKVAVDTALHAVAITAAPQTMGAIEDAITRLDTPAAAPKNIDLICYFIIGSETDGAGSLPKDLDSVVTQLKNTFPFKSYRLLDVLTTRTRTGMSVDLRSLGGAVIGGSAEVSGPAAREATITTLHVNSLSLGGDAATIRVDGLRANSRVAVPAGNQPFTSFGFQDLGINTDVDMKEGQKIVVGRVGITRDQALFLVLTAKVIG